MKRFCLITVILIGVVFFTCSKNPVFDNPYNSKCDPDTWSPNNLKLEQIGVASIKLSWDQEIDKIDGFKIDRKIDEDEWQIEYASLDKNIKTYIDTGAVPTQKNYYRIYAYADENNSVFIYTSLIVIDVAPTNLVAQIIDNNTIKLTWVDNCAFETGFGIERKEENGSFQEIAKLGINSTQYIDNSLESLKNYLYRINAYTDNNNSTYSDVYKITRSIKDIDENVYKIVKIGNQWWMAENLKVTHYQNGEAIPKVTDNTEWGNLTTGAYCIYGSNDTNADTYGCFYNWSAVVNSRNIAPAGWHVSTDDEWEELAQYISDQNGGYSKSGDVWYDVGAHLKSTSGWTEYNGISGNGTDNFGFSAIPAGHRLWDGIYSSIGNNTSFWSFKPDTDFVYRYIEYNGASIYRYDYNWNNGNSVRCVKD